MWVDILYPFLQYVRPLHIFLLRQFKEITIGGVSTDLEVISSIIYFKHGSCTGYQGEARTCSCSYQQFDDYVWAGV